MKNMNELLEKKKPDTRSMKAAGVVYMSYNYDMFSYFDANREPNHWPKIAQSIEEKDLTPYVPILVDRQLNIIDGQGRFRACIENDMPVYFIIGDSCVEEDIIRLNIGRTDWSMIDYLRYYVDHNYPDYILLYQTLKQMKHLNLNTLVNNLVSVTSDGMSKKETFQKGLFRYSKKNASKAIKIDGIITSISGHISKKIYNHSYFIRTIIKINNNKDVNMEQMIHKIRTFPSLLEKQVTREAYLDNLELVYNYKSRDKISFKYPNQ